jgi:hypothetical protein
MTPTESPLRRTVRLGNLIWGIFALIAVIVAGAAFAEGRYGMASAVIVFFVIAVVARIWVGRVS